MDDEDVAKAVEERRAWLEKHLHQAAERLGTDLSGDKVVNTYDMRSAGSQATEQDGTQVWLRVVLSVPDYQPACRWDGNTDANTVTGVPKPRVLRCADWHDTTNYRGGNMLLRGEVMTLAPGTAIAPEGSLRRDPGLPSSWWDNLTQALTALAAHPVPDHEPVNTVDYVINNTRAHFDVEIDRAVFDQVTWTTAHNDLHWGNVTGPELCILDWESWGRAPAGYDAVSHNFVAALWREHGLRPQRQGTFKLSTDPHFEEKVIDVVGLYLDPPRTPSSCRSTRNRR